MKKYLFIIDPQNDFIEGGSLAVPGGKEALQRIVDSGILDREDWDSIIVSLDSHNPSHLGFGEPKTELRKHLLECYERPTPWPPHCVIDTPGWEIYGPLQEKLLKIPRIIFLQKGKSDFDDCYSIWSEYQGAIMLQDQLKHEDEPLEFYWTGLAEDFCVYDSILDVIYLDKNKKIHHTLFSDMTACIENHINGNENITIKPYTENS